jgi:alanine racemase
VARALERLDPFAFGVATLDEGAALRAAGVTRPVIVFTPVQGAELAELRAAKLTPILARAEDIHTWRLAGGGPWHLPIDTGMGRCGVPWGQVESLVQAASHAPPEGAFTHFHSAERDDGSVAEQEQRFTEAVARLARRPRYLHAENSAALARRDRSPWDLARPGIFLYGVGSGSGALVQPEPVVNVRARIVSLRTIPAGATVSYGAEWRAGRESRVATAAIGYADGYRRAFSGVGAALVRGQRVKVAGIVTMDMTMLDVTGVPCEIGDAATFLGRDGGSEITIDEAAATSGISPYELLTGFGARPEHSYRGAP